MQQCYEALLQWVRATEGSFVGPIAMHQFPDTGRGIQALQDLHAGQSTLKIPESLLMHAGSAAQILQAAQTDDGVSDEEVLALHLLDELYRGPDSRWAPYLALLPSSYTTLACFPAAAVASLQAPHAVQAAEHSRQRLLQSYARMQPALHRLGMCRYAAGCAHHKLVAGIQPASVQQWAWAQSTCSSRTMYMPTSTAGALTPLGDLHNYTPPPAPHVPDIGTLAQPRTTSAEMHNQHAQMGLSVPGDKQWQGARGPLSGRRTPLWSTPTYQMAHLTPMHRPTASWPRSGACGDACLASD